jgi:hypothetical protein
MATLTLEKANAIVDRISALLLSGRNLQPVALSEVGASSTLEALQALYLVTAETFQKAALNPSRKNQELLQRFVQSADGTGMWIAMFFRDKVHPDQAPGMDESLRDTETVGSFVEYLHSLNPASNNYWAQVHARIGG